MAYRLIWSRVARDDLHQIVRFIARNDRNQAAAFGLRLIEAIEQVQQFPEMGRMVPERADSQVREIIVRPYRIIYRVDHSRSMIEVVRIWHGARGEPQMA
jgi:toxin ParE1/3/4